MEFFFHTSENKSENKWRFLGNKCLFSFRMEASLFVHLHISRVHSYSFICISIHFH